MRNSFLCIGNIPLFNWPAVLALVSNGYSQIRKYRNTVYPQVLEILPSGWIILIHFQAGMVLTLCDHNPELLTVTSKYQMLVYLGDAFYNDAQYKKAEVCLAAEAWPKCILHASKASANDLSLHFSDQGFFDLSFQDIYQKALQTKKLLMKSKGKSVATHAVSAFLPTFSPVSHLSG